MLHAELFNNLDMIAFEGWEYHKLPSENLEDCWSSPIRETSKPLVATFPDRSNYPGLNPAQPDKGRHLLNPIE